MASSLAAIVDLDRYPVDDLTDARTIVLTRDCRSDLDATGVAVIPDFLRPEARRTIIDEVARLAGRSHHQDLRGSPYLELPAPDWPEGHPRLAEGRSSLTAIAYDDFASDSPLRTLYEWDPFMDFLARALDRDRLYRYDDPLGALNVAAMAHGDELAWHFDQTDFVVSIALQSSDTGGDFESASLLRSPEDECYEDVRAVLAGERRDRVTTVSMEPGTLMVFEGRHSLHRVTPIGGATVRYVALLAYDTKPGTCSSELLRLVRYGRAEARPN